jgi:hypothetical protein
MFTMRSVVAPDSLGVGDIEDEEAAVHPPEVGRLHGPEPLTPRGVPQLHLDLQPVASEPAFAQHVPYHTGKVDG